MQCMPGSRQLAGSGFRVKVAGTWIQGIDSSSLRRRPRPTSGRASRSSRRSAWQSNLDQAKPVAGDDVVSPSRERGFRGNEEGVEGPCGTMAV